MKMSMYVAYALGKYKEGVFNSAVEALKYFYDKGIRYGTVCNDEYEGHQLKEYVDLLKEAGLETDSYVTIVNTASFDKNERRKNIDIVKKDIDQMEKIGIPFLMVAPSVELVDTDEELHKMREILVESFAEITEYSKGAGIVTTLENQSLIRRADSTIKDVKYILDAVPDLRYVLDAGNFFCVREDALEAYEILKDKIVLAHYKDWAYVESGGFTRENMKNFDGVPFGKGEVPLAEISKRLVRDGFDISVLLEYNAMSKTIDQLGESAEFMVKLFEKLSAEKS